MLKVEKPNKINMKKLIATVLVAMTILVATPVRAQAVDILPVQQDLEGQYRALLIQVIELLKQQLAILVAQLERQKELELREMPKPKNIDKATNVKIDEATGDLLPSVILQARATRTINPNPGHFKTEDIWQDGKQINVRTGSGVIPDELNILVNVGNPDVDYLPKFTCEKFGQWQGPVDPSDHWEKVADPQPGVYGIRCSLLKGGSSEDSVVVKIEK